MCGRFALDDDGTAVAEQFDLSETPALAQRYNIAPTQPVAAVAHAPDGSRQLAHFRWGLIPSWAKDTRMASRMINARAETVAEKPAYRAAFKRRRCLVPMTGFYEWIKQPDGRKQPVYIHPQDERLFGVAGLWEQWQDAEGNEVASCTVVTTTPNALMEPLHNRMPVILQRDEYELWLDTKAPLAAVHSLLKPCAADMMAYYPVSTYVNSPRNQGIDCLQPLA